MHPHLGYAADIFQGSTKRYTNDCLAAERRGDVGQFLGDLLLTHRIVALAACYEISGLPECSPVGGRARRAHFPLVLLHQLEQLVAK